MKVAVFGLGYAGAVSAACLAQGEHDVWGVDIDAGKVEAIEAGRSPVVEPGLDVLVANAIARGTLHATTDVHAALDHADVALVCVGTPTGEHGGVDLRHVASAVRQIGDALATTAPPASGTCIVVVRSTVPPGTVEDFVAPILAECAPAGCAIELAMCPEFLREGSGVRDFFDPPFTVIGAANRAAGEKVAQLFGASEARVRIVAPRTAEALKYACNAFHATKVSFANEIARLFREMDVDAREVMDVFCEDDRLNISPSYLRPGFAFGGSCLPKDLRALLYLARVKSVDLPLLAGTLQSNEITINDVVNRVIATGAARVAILGLSFKSSTDDLRESPAVTLGETLLGKGFDVRIYDPVVKPARLIGGNLTYVESKLPHISRLLTASIGDAVRGADVAVVSYADDAVRRELAENPATTVIDLCGRLGAAIEARPNYSGIGW